MTTVCLMEGEENGRWLMMWNWNGSQIREKQLKDKEAWMKKFIPLLDKTLEERLGELYWYGHAAEDICTGFGQIKKSGKDAAHHYYHEKEEGGVQE